MRQSFRFRLLVSLLGIGIGSLSQLATPSASGADPQFERVQLSSDFYAEGGTFGDYNGDGKGDVVVGPFIYWGPDFEKQSRYYEGPAIDPIGYSENFLMYSDDVDADGKRDILVLGFPGKESWWYQNPGHDKANTGLWKRHTMLDSVDNESPLIGDIDGDKVLDLVCSSKGCYGYASHAGRTPTDVWSFRNVSPNNGYQRFTHGIGIGDVDNDGLVDLLEKDGWWKNPGKAAPADKLWDFKPFAFSATGGSQMYALDLDGDGKNEVLTGLVAHGFGLAYYKATNAEATQFERVDIMTDKAESSPVGLAVSQLHAVALGDMNGDGLMDIVTGKRWWAHGNKDDGNSQPATLLWLETQRAGGRVKFVPHVIDTSSGVGTQITVGDVNGDGLADVVSGTKRGAHVFLQRPATLAADKFLVPGLAAKDPFYQQPASGSVAISDAIGGKRPAMGDKPLNFDFELASRAPGSLRDWEVRGSMGKALLVAAPESDNAAAGAGKQLASTGDDKLIGELISRPFKLTDGFASCLIAGSEHAEARVELISERSGQVLASVSGGGKDQLKRVSMDVSNWKGEFVRLRLVDHANDAHLMFDDFRLHEKPLAQ